MKKIFLVVAASLLLAACGAKTTATITPTPVQKVFEIPIASRPYVSLIPREDGHLLTLKVNNIPTNISQIEYQVLYTAVDQGNEIEKGVGDTIKNVKGSIEKTLLLGTESCTSGCKYNYDAGVVGGTITLNFITADNQVATYEAPFTLKSIIDVKKSKELTLPTENLTIKTTPTGTGFLVLLKNYQNIYSVFSSSTNSSKFTSISPATVTKKSSELVGDYVSAP
jgi:hypothetical protein